PVPRGVRSQPRRQPLGRPAGRDGRGRGRVSPAVCRAGLPPPHRRHARGLRRGVDDPVRGGGPAAPPAAVARDAPRIPRKANPSPTGMPPPGTVVPDGDLGTTLPDRTP